MTICGYRCARPRVSRSARRLQTPAAYRPVGARDTPVGPTEAAVGLVNGLWQRTPIANGCDAINLLRGIYLGGYVPTRRRDARPSRGFAVRRRSCSFLLQWRGVPITL